MHGGGEPSGAGTDDHHVVLSSGRLGREPQQLRHATELRPYHGLAVDDPDRRAISIGRQRSAPLLGGIGRVGPDPPERDLVAVEEASQLGA